MKKQEQKRILSKYSKEEIIDSVLSEVNDFYISRVINKLFHINYDNMYETMIRAEEKDAKAFQAYVDFKNSIVEKYGKDGKYNLNDIPPQDFKKLQDLLVEWKKTTIEDEKANKKLDKLYGRNEK